MTDALARCLWTHFVVSDVDIGEQFVRLRETRCGSGVSDSGPKPGIAAAARVLHPEGFRRAATTGYLAVRGGRGGKSPRQLDLGQDGDANV